MRYLGGKSRLRHEIASYLTSIRGGLKYFEPFVGGGWVLQEMSGVRYASDVNEFLITLYKSLQSGWVPPDELSEREYNIIRQSMDKHNPLTAFAGICCSFGGKWFGGYARNASGTNYARTGKKSLLKQLPKIIDVKFATRQYYECNPKGLLIYCDPPYNGTTEYAIKTKFDYNLYYSTMKEWSKDNIVIMSEYSMPKEFKIIREFRTNSCLRIGSTHERIERLFRL